MDLGPRARQTQHGERGEEEEEARAPRYRMCVYRVDLCSHRKAETHTHTVWLDICTIERVLVDSAGVPGWEVDIPPQDSSNLQSCSPVGSNGFHPRCQIGFVLSSPLCFLTTTLYLLSWLPSELPP